MSRVPFDIEKSKKAGKLITGQSWLKRFFESVPLFIFVGMFVFVAIMQLYSNVNKNEAIGPSILFLICVLMLCGVILYSMSALYKLKRIKGVSKGKNAYFIHNIITKNNWQASIHNRQVSIIPFSWRDSGTDWGKQITILYDKDDILVNCISFGIHAIPSPFHGFANRRKVNKLIASFEKEKQAFYENRK